MIYALQSISDRLHVICSRFTAGGSRSTACHRETRLQAVNKFSRKSFMHYQCLRN